MTGACSATALIMRPIPNVTPALDWSAWPGPQGGLLGAVEMCNNNGTCRKPNPDVMCPSFRATRNERDLTRGRANTLRLALTGQFGPEALASDEVAAALSLCVSCKACKRECPTGVDMAKMKIEALHARAKARGISAKDRLIADMPRWAPFAARVPFLANARSTVPGLAALSERAARLRRRTPPAPLPPRRLPRRRAAGADGPGRRGDPLPGPVQPLLRAGEPARRRPGAPGGRLSRRRSPGRRGDAARSTAAAPTWPPAWWRRRGRKRGGRWKRSAASARPWSASSPPTC